MSESKIEVYTMKETAELLKVSYVYLTQIVKEGRLQAVKVGKRKVITREAIEKFLEANKC